MSFDFSSSASTGCNLAWKSFAFSVNTIHNTFEATLGPTGLLVGFTVGALLKYLTSHDPRNSESPNQNKKIMELNTTTGMPRNLSDLSKSEVISGTATLIMTLSLINFIHYRYTVRFFC